MSQSSYPLLKFLLTARPYERWYPGPGMEGAWRDGISRGKIGKVVENQRNPTNLGVTEDRKVKTFL